MELHSRRHYCTIASILLSSTCLSVIIQGVYSAERPSVFYKENTANNDNNEQWNCNLTIESYKDIQKVIETILDQKLKIMFDSQNNMNHSTEKLHQKIDHITDHVLPELSTNIFNRISSKMDSAFKENHQLLESKINLQQDKSINEIQNKLISKLDPINGLYKNSTTTILLEQTKNITKISHQLVELKNKLETFERNTNESEHKILHATNTQYLNEKVNSVHDSIRELKLNVSKKIQTLEAKISQQIDVIKNNEIESSNYKTSIEKMTTQQMNNITFQVSDIRAHISKCESKLNSIEDINQKVSALDRFHSLEERTRLLFKSNTEIQKSVAKVDQKSDTLVTKLNQQLGYLEKNNNELNKYRKGQESIEIMTTEQIKNITFQMSDIRLYVSKHEIMLKPIEEIKRKVTVLERFQSLEQNFQDLFNVSNNMQSSVANLRSTYKETQESVEKVTAEQMNNINAQISDIRKAISKNDNMLKSIEEIKQKVTVLDRFQSLEQHIQFIWNVTKQTQISEKKTNQKELQRSQKVTSLCDVTVPAAIVAKHDIWKAWQVSEKDDLDTYMINKTGCSYLAVERYKLHALAAGPLPGQLEWRVAVRARGGAEMWLQWDSETKYEFHVGADGNTMSWLYDNVHAQYPERATPGVLAEDRYVPLYLKIANGKLTAGAECEPEPWFTADFPREEGELIESSVYSGSYYGAKLLYDCPASFTGQ